MNRKGFTLIELLAIIVLIGIVGVITVPNVLDAVSASRSASYKIFIKNIVTASENYYMECEYGDLSDSSIYGDYACSINDNSITTKLGTLANTGFLKTNTTEQNGTKVKIVKDPRNENILNDCEIIIAKKIKKVNEEDSIITYTVTSDDNSNCPSTEDYEVNK